MKFLDQSWTRRKRKIEALNELTLVLLPLGFSSLSQKSFFNSSRESTFTE